MKFQTFTGLYLTSQTGIVMCALLESPCFCSVPLSLALSPPLTARNSPNQLHRTNCLLKLDEERLLSFRPFLHHYFVVVPGGHKTPVHWGTVLVWPPIVSLRAG